MNALKKLIDKIKKAEKLKVFFELTLPFVVLLGFFLFAVGVLIIYSFWTLSPDLNILPIWTISNYKSIFTENFSHFLLFLKTVGIVGVVTIGCLVTAYPAAYWVAMKSGRKKYMYTVLFLMPFLVSWIILVFGWKLVLGYNGLINTFLIKIGLIESPLRSIMDNIWTVIIVLIMGWTSWAALPLFVSLDKIDKSLLEAGADLGATPWRNFRRITLPLSIPGILVATFFVFIPMLGEFVAANVVGGTTPMFGILIDVYFKKMFAWPYGAALSVLLLITSLGISAILIRLAGLKRLMESL